MQQASNEIIKTVTAAAPLPSAAGSPVLPSSTPSTDKAPAKTDDKVADKVADKTDSKEVASSDKTGTKNEPTKKMYCN